jgi:NAD+ kinase
VSGPVATVLTHRRPSETGPAIQALLEVAQSVGARLVIDEREATKHKLQPADGIEITAAMPRDVDICFALGGDGTMLSALRTYAGTGVPVFGVNFGEVGFLATIDREDARSGFQRAFAREFDTLALPGIAVHAGRVSGSRRWPIRSARTRSGACAVTGSSSPHRQARRATTSPTADRSWHGGWRA